MSGTEPGIWLGVLGPIRVVRDGIEADLPGRRAQLLLALLAARANHTVSTTELIGLLWEGEPPSNALNMLRRHVGEIRRAFEPGLPFRAEGRWLAGVPGGYRFKADPSTCDLLRFRALAAQATSTPDWIAALGLWRGTYADGLGGSSEAFAAVNEERAAASVRAAHSIRRAGPEIGGLLPLIQETARLNPLDEALAAEVVRLLAVDGRREEAIAWFRTTEARIADQLGVAPGPVLAGALPTSNVSVRDHAAPAQLPSDLWLFGGRRPELDALERARASFPGLGIIAIDGIPGVGKSTLAVHWAHRIAGDYPDGQLFVNLRGYGPADEPTDPSTVLAGFLEALGVQPEELPPDLDALAALFRTRTHDRRLLIVLDNARQAEQVRPLIPAGPGCLVVVTSRTRMSTLAAHEGAVLVGLDLPGSADARVDLRRRLPAGLNVQDDELDEIIDHCGRLPLAVSLVAARVQGGPGEIKALLAELRRSRDSLDALGVRAVFSWSYRRLTAEAARLFRLLPSNTGPDATLPLLASLAGLPRDVTRRLVHELTRTRLLTEPHPGRFAQHDLVAVYAAELAAEQDSGPERAHAADRALDHFTRTLQQINALHLRPTVTVITGDPLPGVEPEIFEESLSALDWLKSEIGNLGAAVHDAYRRGRHPWQTVVDSYEGQLRAVMAFRTQWVDLARPALAAATATGDLLAEAHLRRLLGTVAALDGRAADAEYERARTLAEGLGDIGLRAAIEIKIAELYTLDDNGPFYEPALPHLERAVELFRASGNRLGERQALIGLGRCRFGLGRATEGTETLVDAVRMDLDDRGMMATATIFLHLGDASGRPDVADLYLASHRLFQDGGNVYWAMATALRLAQAYLDAGRHFDAAAVWQRASATYADFRENGRYLSTDVRRRYATLAAGLGEALPLPAGAV